MVLGLTGGAPYGTHLVPGRVAPVAAPVAAAPAPPDLADVPAEALRGAADGHAAVAVLDLATGTGASHGEDAFVTASIVKADILAALLLRAPQTGLTAAQRTAAELMIERSDNDSASELYRQIGGAAGLDEANAVFGLTGTSAGADGYWGLTSTTAADQLRLLQVVFGPDSPLDADAQAYLQGLMGRISGGQGWGVSAAGPALLKNGWLPRDDTGLWVVNSIGRVTVGQRRLLVAVLSDGSPDLSRGIAVVESLAVAATGFLTAELTAESTAEVTAEVPAGPAAEISGSGPTQQ
ncbi:hypothetical protein [Kitasatospora sp. NPDC088346]|uniref:hypothetical protein n=1 Tax=Kitasatospora sp. NPDC088346 TaxID=3364073 RepID=UPI00381000A2